GVVENVYYRLGALVIRRHATPDQPERCRHSLEDLDLDAIDGNKFGCGIAGSGASTDYRDPQRAFQTEPRSAVLWRGNWLKWMPFEIRRVDRLEGLEFERQLLFVVDRIDWAR